MEHHPIPQDITGFQFKLIGEMTVKQFTYIAAGVILSVVSFYAPLFFILKLPLVFFFGGLGAALAFLPVEGRPLDTMLGFYIRALFSPAQYVYQKTGMSIPEQPQQQVHMSPMPNTATNQQIMQPIQSSPKQPLDEFLASVQLQNKQAAMSDQSPPVMQAVPLPSIAPEPTFVAAPQPHIVSIHDGSEKKALPPIYIEEPKEEVKVQTEEQKKEAELEREELVLQKELAQAKLLEQQQKTVDTSKAAHEKTLALEKEMQEIASQKASLEQELLQLRRQLAASQQQVHTPGAAQAEPAKQEPAVSQQVRQINKPQARATGLPQVHDANIIAGVVKDSRGNVLTNILVEILDQQNNPVRAFKTNQLGQFLSATQLPNGTYKMTFEDPKGQHTFDIIQIVANGEILLPLEVVSQDAREALRKELFS